MRAHRRSLKKNRKEEGIERAIGEFSASLRGTKIDVPHISEVAAVVIKKLGGLEKFSDIWVENFNKVTTDSKGKKVALDAISAISKLIQISTEHRQTAPDLASMTDEELDRESRRMMFAQIQESPELLAALAEEAGYVLPETATTTSPEGYASFPPDSPASRLMAEAAIDRTGRAVNGETTLIEENLLDGN
jgi:hypothetical protein